MKNFYKWLLRNIGSKLPDPDEWGGKFKWCNKLRCKWARRISSGISKKANISRGARICGDGTNLCVSDYASIGINCEVGSNLKIEEHVMMGPSCTILTENHKFNPDLLEFDGYESKTVFIGSHTWIGKNVIILPGAKIGHHCIIGAGSVVPCKEYPDYSLICGNPAVVKKLLRSDD